MEWLAGRAIMALANAGWPLWSWGLCQRWDVSSPVSRGLGGLARRVGRLLLLTGARAVDQYAELHS